VTSRLLIRLFLAAVVLGAVASGVAWFFFGEPAPESEFFYVGNQVVDLRFSPDGQKLAIVSLEVPPPDSAKFQVTRIVRVSDGELIHGIPNAAWKCAWNSDGSLLATVGVNGIDFALWETKKWSLKRQLVLTPPPAAKNSADAGSDADTKALDPGIVQRLCFNRQGSLFAVSFAADSDSHSDYNHAKIWWDPLGKSAVAESIGSCGGPWDLAVADSGKDSLVALCYKTPCSPEVLKIGVKSGKTQVEGKVVLKDLPHELSSPRIDLAPDGNILLARDAEHLDMFVLSSGEPRLVSSIDSLAPIVKGSLLIYKRVVISRDGRFAAYDTEGHLNVIRLPDGKPVLTITHVPCALALAPDGSLLAIADSGRHSILFYRVPGGGSGSTDAGNSPAAHE
jgi:WD40 repeat protein